jgi:hypothetical protein
VQAPNDFEERGRCAFVQIGYDNACCQSIVFGVFGGVPDSRLGGERIQIASGYAVDDPTDDRLRDSGEID